MPTYTFVCKKCGARDELLLEMKDRDKKRRCKTCKSGFLRRTIEGCAAIKVVPSAPKAETKPRVNASYSKKRGFHG